MLSKYDHILEHVVAVPSHVAKAAVLSRGSIDLVRRSINLSQGPLTYARGTNLTYGGFKLMDPGQRRSGSP